MFKGLGQMAALMRQAQQLGGQMKEVNEKMAQTRVTGTAAGGLVEVQANGLGEILHVTIEPKLFDDNERDMVQDLLPAAINQALAKAREAQTEQLGSLAQGLDLGSLGDMLGGLDLPNNKPT